MLCPLNSSVGPSGALSAASIGERNINGKSHPGPFLRRLGEGACDDVDRCEEQGENLIEYLRVAAVFAVTAFHSLAFRCDDGRG